MAKATKETIHHLADLLESNGLEASDASVLLRSMKIDITDMQLLIDIKKQERESFNRWLMYRVSIKEQQG
jgi:site-specific recombinase|tara:strand:- start:317 stop:526 length:210 start_codon:yes stop_codon:yes gene_type:complete